MGTEPEIKLDIESVEPEAPDYSEVEIEAMEHGWNPEGVEGKRNLSAEEFMDRKPLYDEIHSTKKQIKRLQEGMDLLKAHHERVAELERAKALDYLKNQKKIALENEDFDAVLDIDDKIAEQKAAPNAAAPASNSAFEEWVEENTWYNQDSELKEYADMIGNGYAASHPKKPLTDIYEYVSKEVKSRFPEKFGNTARHAPSPVEGGSKRRTTSRKLSARDLPEDDYRIMKTIVRAGGITEEQYLKEYAELNSQ